MIFTNLKLSLYFCCILAKILSITSVTVIKAPTRVQQFKPYINGKREITTVIMERTNNALRTPFFFNENNESKKMATVSVAVISGAKFAQPNGVRLKYENVSFTLSVGDVAKIQTAPKGNNSNTIVKAGKTAKQTFFMLYISFTNSSLQN